MLENFSKKKNHRKLTLVIFLGGFEQAAERNYNNVEIIYIYLKSDIWSDLSAYLFLSPYHNHWSCLLATPLARSKNDGMNNLKEWHHRGLLTRPGN